MQSILLDVSKSKSIKDFLQSQSYKLSHVIIRPQYIDINLPFLIYNGRGPTTQSLHIGHLYNLQFTRQLLEYLPNAKLFYMLSDDQKILQNCKLDETIITKNLQFITKFFKN